MFPPTAIYYPRSASFIRNFRDRIIATLIMSIRFGITSLRVWFHSAEVTMLRRVACQNSIRRSFNEIAAQKTCAAKIPLAAVCYKYGRTDVLPAWSRFLERYGWWGQMLNDTFDWLKDSQNNGRNVFPLRSPAAKVIRMNR